MLPLIPDIQIGGFPLPAGSPHTQPVYYKAFSAKGIFITPNGAAKMDAVEKFVKFMFQPEMIARFVEQAGMNPSITGVTVDESKLNPLFAQTLNMDAEVVDDLRRVYARRSQNRLCTDNSGSIYKWHDGGKAPGRSDRCLRSDQITAFPLPLNGVRP